MSNGIPFLRIIDTIRALPLDQWVTTEYVRDRLEERGHKVSKRTTERDLRKLAQTLEFGIEWRIVTGIGNPYEWRRSLPLE